MFPKPIERFIPCSGDSIQAGMSDFQALGPYPPSCLAPDPFRAGQAGALEDTKVLRHRLS
jgi:hypothetical protein